MKLIYKDVALRAGGSHYPEVGGALLETFADLLVKDIIDTIKDTPKHCAFTTHDLGTVDCTIHEIIKTLEQRFDV